MELGLYGGPVTPEGTDVGEAYRDFADYIVQAEALGFHSFFMVEHHFTGVGQASSSLALLSYLAGRTSRIRLGTGVVVLPWHNPVLVTEQAATLDVVSGGRLDFGIGRGYRPYEFKGFRIPPQEAAARFDEAVTFIRKAWSAEGRFSFQSEHWAFDDIVIEPQPLQKPHPPFWLGATSPDSVRRAAEQGYNLLLGFTSPIADTIALAHLFRDHCHEIGRPFDPMTIAVTRAVGVAQTEAERREHLYRRRAAIASGQGFAPRSPAGAPLDIAEDNDAFLFGTAEEIAEKLDRFRQAGVTYILLSDMDNSPATLEFVTEMVRPLLR